MKHIRSSATNSIYFLENYGNPNNNQNVKLTDFEEPILSGSLCVDRVNNVLYILKGDVWESVGKDFEALIVQENNQTAIVMADYNDVVTYGVVINSPNSKIEKDVKNSVIVSGHDINATLDNTLYAEQLGFYGTSGTSGISITESILISDNLTSSRTWKLPDSSGTIALVDDIKDLLDLIDGGLFGTNFITSVPTTKDKDLISLTTNGDNSLASLNVITNTPINNCYITVFVNGQEFEVGNGTKDKPFYFSSDGGITAKGFDDANLNGRVIQNDSLYYNSSYTGFELQAGWRISLHYNILCESESLNGTNNVYEIKYLHQLYDVDLTPPVLDTHYLKYDTTTQKWINTEIPELVDNIIYLTETNITSNKKLDFVINNGYKIQDIIIKENNGLSANDINIGSISEGNDIVNANTVGANALVDCLISKNIFSLTSNTNAYISSNNWNGSSITIYMTIRKVSI